MNWFKVSGGLFIELFAIFFVFMVFPMILDRIAKYVRKNRKGNHPIFWWKAGIK